MNPYTSPLPQPHHHHHSSSRVYYTVQWGGGEGGRGVDSRQLSLTLCWYQPLHLPPSPPPTTKAAESTIQCKEGGGEGGRGVDSRQLSLTLCWYKPYTSPLPHHTTKPHQLLDLLVAGINPSPPPHSSLSPPPPLQQSLLHSARAAGGGVWWGGVGWGGCNCLYHMQCPVPAVLIMWMHVVRKALSTRPTAPAQQICCALKHSLQLQSAAVNMVSSAAPQATEPDNVALPEY